MFQLFSIKTSKDGRPFRAISALFPDLPDGTVSIGRAGNCEIDATVWHHSSPSHHQPIAGVGVAKMERYTHCIHPYLIPPLGYGILPIETLAEVPADCTSPVLKNRATVQDPADRVLARFRFV